MTLLTPNYLQAAQDRPIYVSRSSNAAPLLIAGSIIAGLTYYHTLYRPRQLYNNDLTILDEISDQASQLQTI